MLIMSAFSMSDTAGILSLPLRGPIISQRLEKSIAVSHEPPVGTRTFDIINKLPCPSYVSHTLIDIETNC